MLKHELAHDGIRFAAGSKLRWSEGRPVRGVLAARVALAEVTLEPGTTVELSEPEHGIRQTICMARISSDQTIAGYVIPAETELELDDGGHLTGAVLGAAMPNAPGPIEGGSLTYDRGAYLVFARGRWAFSIDDAMG